MTRPMRALRRHVAALTALSLFAACSDPTPLSPDRTPKPSFDVVGTLPAVRFSEIHYDNAGTDAGEAIEVSGPAGMDVTGWTVVLYNGTGGAVYDTKTLAGAFPATCTDRGVLVITYPSNGIQNGSPDGMALVDAAGHVVEFLSYEGTFAGVGGAANGVTSTDIVATETGSGPIGNSLQRNGSNLWAEGASSFGACNDNDTPPPSAEVAHVLVAPATATIEEGGTRQFTATATDASDQPVAGVVFTWSTSAPPIATVSATGLATGVIPGDAQITATAPNGIAGSAGLHVNPATTPTLPPTRFSEIH